MCMMVSSEHVLSECLVDCSRTAQGLFIIFKIILFDFFALIMNTVTIFNEYQLILKIIK